MFGRGAKKEPEKKRNRDLSQFGIFDVPADIGGGDDSEGNDSDLEAELAAITAGSAKPRAKPAKKQLVPAADLDRMVADSLKDIEDDDSDVDENDPDLLNELQGITGEDADVDAAGLDDRTPPEIFVPTSQVNQTDLIASRLEMYRLAESNAKASGDSGKARRFNRGLKTLESQLKQAKLGKPINPEDIPPEVVTKIAAPVQPTPTPPDTASTPDVPLPVATPLRAAPAPPPPTVKPSVEPSSTPTPDPAIVAALLARKREYVVAALTAKKSGDLETAKQFARILKLFDGVIASAQAGQPVDLSDMPPSPGAVQTSAAPAAVPVKEEAERQHEAEPVPSRPVVPDPIPSAPTSVAEALQQRLDKYRSVEKAAKDEGNSSKARRFGRIVKQYEDAVKLHKAGKPVPFDELPTPPGFGPIPGVAPAADEPSPAPVRPVPGPAPAVPIRQPVAPAPPSTAPTVPAQPAPSRSSGSHSTTTVMQKNIAVITERHRVFRQAAIRAKQEGNLDQAKEYLRQYKQIENMLDAARGGMPVDLNTLPVPPAQRANLEDTFTIINDSDCVADGLGDISLRLEQQLQSQLVMCMTTRDHHKAMGDVTGANRFENLALSVQKDFDIVKFARTKNLPVPKFHYEKRSFDIVRCNTDLAESQMEIQLLRGISYRVANPKDVDTYVKIEFPYPQETPFKARSQLIRDTDSPEYNETFVADVQPKQRHCQRVFKRHAVKFEVFSKGGFLRSDTLIGTVAVKLQPLETVCEIHDSFEIMDGRKANGGKLEVKIRLRNPILTTQVQHTDEKWLVIET